MKTDCPLATKRCPQGCGAELQVGKFEVHTKEEVSERSERALTKTSILAMNPAKWPQTQWLHQLLNHPTQLVWHLLRSAQCPKRLVICENCGDDSLFADELDDHLSGNLRDQECSMRNIPCKLCDDTVVAKDMKDHVANRCKKRNITCECGTVIVAETQSDHRILECNAVTRYCSLGCGEKMRVMDMPAHQKSACSKRHLINGKLLLCPLGCGAQVSFAEQFIHMTSMCGKRIVECENHCPEVVREEEVSERSVLSGGAGTYLAT